MRVCVGVCVHIYVCEPVYVCVHVCYFVTLLPSLRSFVFLFFLFLFLQLSSPILLTYICVYVFFLFSFFSLSSVCSLISFYAAVESVSSPSLASPPMDAANRLLERVKRYKQKEERRKYESRNICVCVCIVCMDVLYAYV